jgi:murein DD-endopeptidase MepM/ murein hydrolase activator NlpD
VAEWLAVRSRLILLPVLSIAAAVAGFGLSGAGAVSPASSPTSAASAWSVRISVPGQVPVGTPIVSDSGSSSSGVFTYPADGSVVSAQTTTASVTTSVKRFAAATAQSVVTGLSLFGGDITADGVTARASAGTGFSGAGGNQAGSSVANLVALGQPVSGNTVALADWGTLALGTMSVDRSAPAGTKGYQGGVVELDVKLTAAHNGLPPGTEIQIGFAQAAVQTAPPVPKTATATTETVAPPPPPPSGPQPETRPEEPASKKPLKAHPPLGGEVKNAFPVFGPASYTDTFGATRSNDTFHEGDDIFGTLGQPVVAVTAGIVFAVGYDKDGGNSLWLIDAGGNQFYYAHLSAFSLAAKDGAQVRQGEVIGFMGNTGDAAATPVHLHFEVHPMSLLYLGSAGTVDPTFYLNKWQHLKSLPFPIAAAWAPNVHGLAAGPEPGAILLGMSDISSADGLDPESLQRALEPSPTVSPSHQKPTRVTAPVGDLGPKFGPRT